MANMREGYQWYNINLAFNSIKITVSMKICQELSSEILICVLRYKVVTATCFMYS